MVDVVQKRYLDCEKREDGGCRTLNYGFER
jgi:hypothetical protein